MITERMQELAGLSLNEAMAVKNPSISEIAEGIFAAFADFVVHRSGWRPSDVHFKQDKSNTFSISFGENWGVTFTLSSYEKGMYTYFSVSNVIIRSSNGKVYKFPKWGSELQADDMFIVQVAKSLYQKFKEKSISESKINEAEKTEAEKMGDEIVKLFKRHFPKSYIATKYDTSWGSPTLYIEFGLGANKSEWSWGYFTNDVMQHKIMFHGINADGTLPNKIKPSVITGGGYYTEPEPGRNMAYSYKKVWRQFSGDQTKIINGFSKYFAKLAASILSDENIVQPTIDQFKVKDKVRK